MSFLVNPLLNFIRHFRTCQLHLLLIPGTAHILVRHCSKINQRVSHVFLSLIVVEKNSQKIFTLLPSQNHVCLTFPHLFMQNTFFLLYAKIPRKNYNFTRKNAILKRRKSIKWFYKQINEKKTLKSILYSFGIFYTLSTPFSHPNRLVLRLLRLNEQIYEKEFAWNFCQIFHLYFYYNADAIFRGCKQQLQKN